MSLIIVGLYRYIDPPFTGMMVYKGDVTEDYKSKYIWKDIEEINKNLPLAFVAAEDQQFISHFGFDIEAIKEASSYNEKSSRLARGASTISQQVAKNLFLFPTRSFMRKGVEAYFTLLIESLWSKCRIIEVYANIVELAPGVYGVEYASQLFFNKPAASIRPEEAALMVTVLPNPELFKLSNPSAYMLKRKNWLLKQMGNLGGEEIFNFCYKVETNDS